MPRKPDDTEHHAGDGRRDQEKQTELDDALWAEMQEPGKNSGDSTELWPLCTKVRVVGGRRPGVAEVQHTSCKDDDGGQGDTETEHPGNGDVYFLIGGLAHLDLPRDAAVHHLDAEDDDDEGEHVSEGFDLGFDEDVGAEE